MDFGLFQKLHCMSSSMALEEVIDETDLEFVEVFGSRTPTGMSRTCKIGLLKVVDIRRVATATRTSASGDGWSETSTADAGNCFQSGYAQLSTSKNSEPEIQTGIMSADARAPIWFMPVSRPRLR